MKDTSATGSEGLWVSDSQNTKLLERKILLKNLYLGLEPTLEDMCNLSWVALYHLKSRSLKKVHLVSQSIAGRTPGKQKCPKFSGESCVLTPAMSHYISLRTCKGLGYVQLYSTEIIPIFFFFFFFLRDIFSCCVPFTVFWIIVSV